MNNEQSLDDLRRRMQESLVQARREQLREEFGIQDDLMASKLPIEVELEWLDYIYRFQQQWEQAEIVTVRDRINNPPLQPFEDIAIDKLPAALDQLLELLLDHNIAVDFLGEWEAAAAYRYLFEELLDEEIEDIYLEGVMAHFTPSTAEFDVEMWVEHFVRDIFYCKRDWFLSGLDRQALFDQAGDPLSSADFEAQLEAIWELLPLVVDLRVEPLQTTICDDEGYVEARISWSTAASTSTWTLEATFRLHSCPFDGWDVVQNSLVSELLLLLEKESMT